MPLHCGMEALGCAAAVEKKVHRSATLFGAAQRLRNESHAPLTQSEERFYVTLTQSVRGLVDDSEWDKRWQQGLAMSPEAAIAFASQQNGT